jgi:hypothetical protein
MPGKLQGKRRRCMKWTEKPKFNAANIQSMELNMLKEQTYRGISRCCSDRLGGSFGRYAAKTVLAIILFAGLLSGCRDSRVSVREMSGKPYIQSIGQVESITVWIVNGQYVRENLDEEFTNFGQHYRFSFIPSNEFWLDRQHVPGEEPFFINHLLAEYKLMRNGMEYDDAIDKADIVENGERAKTQLFQQGQALLKTGQNTLLMNKIHKESLPEFGSAAKVFIVDGELVRDLFYIDFTEGGHDKVYEFIPSGEVWIDDDIMPGERKFILLHELHERYLMAQGWNYGKAHRDSSRIEFKCRQHPRELDPALQEEVRKNMQIP